MQGRQEERRIEDDVIALLTAAGVSNPFRMYAERTGTQKSVAVGAYQSEASLDAGVRPSGFLRIPVMLDCQTEIHDDDTATMLRELMGDVREALLTDDILTRLNAESSYVTYYGLEQGPGQIPEPTARFRHGEISLTLTVRPSNATTTTTSTTTSTTSSTTTTTTT